MEGVRTEGAPAGGLLRPGCTGCRGPGSPAASGQTSDHTFVSNLRVGTNAVVTRTVPIAQHFVTGSEANGYPLGPIEIVSADQNGNEFQASLCDVEGRIPVETC